MLIFYKPILIFTIYAEFIFFISTSKNNQSSQSTDIRVHLMCIEIKLSCNVIGADSIDSLSHFYRVYNVLLHIHIDIVHMINRGRVTYLTPQIRLSVVQSRS